MTTITPISNMTNWSSLVPAQSLNATAIDPSDPKKPTNCHHLFGTYIVPDILYFIAYIIGLYHFRIQESEGLYALMEKVGQAVFFSLFSFHIRQIYRKLIFAMKNRFLDLIVRRYFVVEMTDTKEEVTLSVKGH